MKYLFIVLSLATSLVAQANDGMNLVERIQSKNWIHGSTDCEAKSDPAIDILELNQASYILRQNKCVHYEAPFIYVLFGQSAVFIQDTGATSEAETFPLYLEISKLVEGWQRNNGGKELQWLVSHSHSHSDHYAGDVQFEGKENVVLIKPNSQAVRNYFNFNDWPNGRSEIDLGGRTLTIIPLPGHQEDALAVHDSQTNIILTGDSFYPGRLYIKNWLSYKSSMNRLEKLANQKSSSMFLGTHIEMSTESGRDYPIGTTYHPEEASLVLNLDDLLELNEQLQKIGETPAKKHLDKIIIYPVD